MILVVAEHTNGKLSKSTLEMVTAARSIQRSDGVTILLLGSVVATVATEAAAYVDQVLVADMPSLAEYDPEIWTAAVTQIATEGGASTILIGGSRSGREYSPRIAVRINAPLLEDVISLGTKGGILEAQHYVFLSRVTESIQGSGPVAVVTVKPGVFPPAPPLQSFGEQFDVDLDLPTPRLRVIDRTAERSERVSLTEADIIVAGGRGVGSPEAFTTLIEPLADHLGAGIGTTRAIVDSGWRPYAEQVGQTGKTVQPKVYIAIGISGAVQHLSGMNKSKLIVAINRDPDAPIFKIADYGIVGDVHQLVPAILEELKK